MPIPINDAAFEYLLTRAGLTLTDAEKAELKAHCDGIATMAERVRKPRGHMAEPALTYGFADEDLMKAAVRQAMLRQRLEKLRAVIRKRIEIETWSRTVL